MTLKEILQERKRAQNAPATAVATKTDNQVAEQVPACVYSEHKSSEFYALFKDCTDF